MLRKLILEGVGPAAQLDMDFAPRFNFLTGDNGLGKSFLLELTWWSLKRTWHEWPAVPSSEAAQITYHFDGDKNLHEACSPWDKTAQQWRRQPGRPPNPGLVLYARIDGSFSVWDPARNYRLYTRADGGEAESPAAYQFTATTVLEGLRRRVSEGGIEREQVLCAGLIDDWTRWQEAKDSRFELLRKLLAHIGPDEQPLVPGTPFRPSIDDQRDIPTIRMPYDQDVPLTYAPAGVKRMAKLAYLLAWSLAEHRDESTRMGLPFTRQVILLFDEPETHLHPRWQRTVLPSVHRAIEEWSGDAGKPEVQLVVATHSPLVLASMEPIFNTSADALWKLDLVDGSVVVERDEWRRRGDVNRWLMSDVFDLGAATSREVENVLKDASNAFSASVSLQEVQEIDARLARLLPEMDPFLIRWRYHMAELLEGGG